GTPSCGWSRWSYSQLCSSPNSRLLTSSCSWRSLRLDREPELLLGLVHGLVVEVGHARVDAQHGLGDAQFVLAGPGLVVHEGVRDVRLAAVAGGEVDGLLAVLVGALLRNRAQLLEVFAQGVAALRDQFDVLAGE